MLAWVGHSLARLFWLLIPQQPSAQAGSVLPYTSTASRSDRQLDGVDITFLQENFRLSSGGGDMAQSAAVGESTLAASTRLSLVLRGAVAGSVPADSSAIVASGDQQRVYFVGDELQFTTPGVTLDSVHTHYVVLNNNGRHESLWMYEAQGSMNTPVTTAGISRVTPGQADTSTVIAQAADRASAADSASAANSAPAANRSAAQPGERVRIRVYRENGNVRGIQIREDSDQTALAAAGLQAGDVITAIDDIAITQGNDLSSLTRQLQRRDQVSIEVIRNSATMTVTVSRDAFAF
jgi:general secretion pathway protein C